MLAQVTTAARRAATAQTRARKRRADADVLRSASVSVVLVRLSPADSLRIEEVSTEAFDAPDPSRDSARWARMDAVTKAIALCDPDLNQPFVDEVEADQAAMRGHLHSPADHGITVTRLVVVDDQTGRHQRTVYGPLSAIQRAFPDAQTRAAWDEAGIARPRGAATLVRMDLYPLTVAR